ncbi:MAG TPA: CsbD family protein [Polyangiaceae bacterium]|jgi:uncharacterized protein YjbJ (UPF0337 family)|nr:CsbD family protein [Polyangiaceae bacterium]
MNQDQVQGKWAQLKGNAKKAWGRFTGNDVKLVEGALQEHHGAIQAKLGDNASARDAQVAQLVVERGDQTQSK